MSNMMMLLQATCVLMFMSGSALSMSVNKNLDHPNYLQFILASYKSPKGAPPAESHIQKADGSDAGQSMSPQLESLLELRRDIYHAYNLTYQIKDPMGRILYRNEQGDGSGSLKGSMNFTKDNGKKAVINYSLQVEEHLSTSSEKAPEQMHEPNMRSSEEGSQIRQESYNQKELPQVISVSRVQQMLKSTIMGNKGKVVQKERYFYPQADMRSDSTYDDLETLPSQMVEDQEQAPAYDDDMQGSVMVYQIKPKARGYEQVWKKGEGLVVDREYDLPNYEYRSAGMQQRADVEEDEDEKPVYIYVTKPSVRVIEVFRDTNGNYQIPKKYKSNIKQQRLGDDGSYQILKYSSNAQQQGLEDGGNYQILDQYSGNIKQQGFEDDGSYQTPEKYSGNIKQQRLEEDGNYKILENYNGNIKQQGLEDDGSYQTPEKYSSNTKQQGLEDDGNYQTLENYSGNINQQAQEDVENYQVSENYRGNIKPQRIVDDGEEPLYMTRSKPAVHVMQLNSDGGDSQAYGGGTQEQYPTYYEEMED